MQPRSCYKQRFLCTVKNQQISIFGKRRNGKHRWRDHEHPGKFICLQILFKTLCTEEAIFYLVLKCQETQVAGYLRSPSKSQKRIRPTLQLHNRPAVCVHTAPETDSDSESSIRHLDNLHEWNLFYSVLKLMEVLNVLDGGLYYTKPSKPLVFHTVFFQIIL